VAHDATSSAFSVNSLCRRCCKPTTHCNKSCEPGRAPSTS